MQGAEGGHADGETHASSLISRIYFNKILRISQNYFTIYWAGAGYDIMGEPYMKGWAPYGCCAP